MFNTALTKQEITILRKYQKSSPLTLIRLKSTALLMLQLPVKQDDIAFVTGKSARTISRWIFDFNSIRLASLFTGHAYNQNASKLTKSQREEIKNTLVKPPSMEGLPFEFWDVPRLKNYIKAEFNVEYESERSYHFLLKFSDLSFKNPSPFNIRRDEDFIEKRMKEIRKEISEYMTSPKWEVFASDETRIQEEALIRRAWIKKGEKTVLKVIKSKDAQNYLGHLNLKNGKVSLLELPWQNQEEILKSFEKFLTEYKDKRICIIWDNAAFHKGKKIREALGKGNLLERVHLIALPPYAPDKNPIELVWGHVKNKISNIQFENLEETKKQFRLEIEKKAFNYKI